MAWGGADEQKKEVAAGNANAKDWHDEALKMVQKTVEEYWNECKGSNAPTSANHFAFWENCGNCGELWRAVESCTAQVFC